MFILVFGLTGCSWQGSIGRGAPIVVPPGEKTIVEPSGTIIEEPVQTQTPIDTVNTALQQAQTTRILIRQLAR
jgi:hypothetical protein